MIVQQIFSEQVKARVQLRTGVSISFVEQGDINGEAVILLHGFTDSSFSYSGVLPLFSPRYHIFALDHRGHGDSSKEAPSFTIQDLVDDVLAFMDTHGLDKATVVGHSLSSMVAQKLAIQAPARVDRLVLIGAFVSGGIEAVAALNEVVQTLDDPVDVDFVREFQSGTIYRSIPEAFYEQVILESSGVPARVWRELLADLTRQDTLPALPSIQAPTLILWGDQETVVPWHDQQTLAQQIPNATLLVYEQTGHALQWEVPERFVADVEEFLHKSSN
jgi:non-heme chloroperoxidase